ncbi:MAG TPA: L-threonylcarbamoyladenylate synthase [Gammaproteobacteria bacterium]
MNAWHIRRAAHVALSGGVIAYPTEAVYGIGCLPWSWPAVERVLRLKQRSRGRGLILIASCLEQVEPLVRFDGIDRRGILAAWPGPVTWILPSSRLVPDWVRGEGGRVAIRVTAYPPARRLCDLTGPLVSTSANPADRPPARNAFRVRAYFPGRLDYIVPGIAGGASAPSEIRDARTGAILRQGG